MHTVSTGRMAGVPIALLPCCAVLRGRGRGRHARDEDDEDAELLQDEENDGGSNQVGLNRHWGGVGCGADVAAWVALGLGVATLQDEENDEGSNQVGLHTGGTAQQMSRYTCRTTLDVDVGGGCLRVL